MIGGAAGAVRSAVLPMASSTVDAVSLAVKTISPSGPMTGYTVTGRFVSMSTHSTVLLRSWASSWITWPQGCGFQRLREGAPVVVLRDCHNRTEHRLLGIAYVGELIADEACRPWSCLQQLDRRRQTRPD